jgi:hypothetical protein
MLVSSVLIEHFAAATAALSAGQRGGGVMAESPQNGNPAAWSRTGQAFTQP